MQSSELKQKFSWNIRGGSWRILSSSNVNCIAPKGQAAFYGLNVCVFLKFLSSYITRRWYKRCKVFGRLFSHKLLVLPNGTLVLIKNFQARPSEDTVRCHQLWDRKQSSQTWNPPWARSSGFTTMRGNCVSAHDSSNLCYSRYSNANGTHSWILTKKLYWHGNGSRLYFLKSNAGYVDYFGSFIFFHFVKN